MSKDSAANNLAVLACGIAAAAQAIVSTGGQVPLGDSSSGGGEDGSGEGGSAAGGLGRLGHQVSELLQFLAEK